MTEITTTLRLTELSHGSGCGCKIDPALLERIIKAPTLSGLKFDSLIGGYESNDDAAVWDLKNGQFLLSTTDFFTPIVDDPFDFGRISAANALSDIYAMGGKPAFALAILGFPVQKLSPEIAQRIMEGAQSVCNEAGIPLAGGHSIDIHEPVFGLVVNGFVDKKFLKRNNTAKAGDILFLTKPIGIGILASALKRGKISDDELTHAVKIMTMLNSCGEQFARSEYVHAMTDVTGFGLLGHLAEMCEGSGLSAVINYPTVRLIPGAEKYAAAFIFPDNTYRNWNAYEKKVKGISGPEFITLCDPQTSGGLLIAVDPAGRKEIISILKDNNLDEHIDPVGQFETRNEYLIKVLK